MPATGRLGIVRRREKGVHRKPASVASLGVVVALASSELVAQSSRIMAPWICGFTSDVVGREEGRSILELGCGSGTRRPVAALP